MTSHFFATRLEDPSRSRPGVPTRDTPTWVPYRNADTHPLRISVTIKRFFRCQNVTFSEQTTIKVVVPAAARKWPGLPL